MQRVVALCTLGTRLGTLGTAGDGWGRLGTAGDAEDGWENGVEIVRRAMLFQGNWHVHVRFFLFCAASNRRSVWGTLEQHLCRLMQ